MADISQSGEDSSQVLLSLGEFMFTVSGLAYSRFRREMSWRWAEQARAGQSDLLQYVGTARKTVVFDGEAHPLYGQSVRAIALLEAEAARGEPLLLINADGDVFGYWVITELSDSAEGITPGGGGRHTTFSLTIKHYADLLHHP
ncbi:phage tail protein [Enterobacter roggenkampii]|uniref:phage tail protein n=1 Tax=Enterobacter roggenkampii TaxID=1812935 RepID=UPI002237803A|nr:phage tail protein [Enterobacter roggenkampii]MCW5003544.1 phage tail protein [Enterobacter roggenkampii]